MEPLIALSAVKTIHDEIPKLQDFWIHGANFRPLPLLVKFDLHREEEFIVNDT